MSLNPYTSPLLDCPGVRHGFFTRKGGVSSGIYNTLNCGPGSDDKPDNVQENRNRVANHLLGKPAPINTLYQIHSSALVTLDNSITPGNPVKADALITKKKGLILGVLTADCAPILFSDPKEGIIAAAHAGWRGALDEIIENVVANMVHLGSSLDNIYAVVGPCIGPKNYEVGPEFRDQFLRLRDQYESFFTCGQGDRFYFDLPGFCLFHLKETGLNKVTSLDLDTYSNPQEFFSFRRTTHKKESDYGRQISAIVLV